MYLATKPGIYRSTDGGVTWGRLPTHDRFRGLGLSAVFIHPGVPKPCIGSLPMAFLFPMMAATAGRRLNSLLRRERANLWLCRESQNDNEIYYTATINNRSTFYKSVDGGRNWITNKLPSGQVPTVLRVHPTREDILYLGFTLLPKQ